MKKLLTISVCLIMLSFSVVQGNEDGFILSFMANENPEPTAGNALIRGGYRYGVSEFFGGCELEDGEFWEVGFLLHSRDVIEPNSISIISPMLTSIFNEQVVITGYSGIHWVYEPDESYSGAIVGIDAKGTVDSPLSIRTEIHYENNLDEDISFHAGLCWRF